MANGFSSAEEIFFEEVVEGFQNTNQFAKNVYQWQPDSGRVERSGSTVRLPYEYMMETATGLDISSSYKDVTELTVPVSLATTDIKNVPFTLSATERNDKNRRAQAVNAGVRRLSSLLDTHVQQTVVNRGALVGAVTGAISTYDDLAKADTILGEVECNDGTERAMFLPPAIANSVAGNIAGRNNLDGQPLTTYQRATLPPVASFDTFKTNVTSSVTGNSETGVLVDGADQDVTPIAWSSDSSPSAGEVDDIRYQTLTVDANTLANGDVITLAGVYRCGLDTKNQSSTLQTFRIISGGGTTTLTISPAIVLDGPYQNCYTSSGSLADNLAITVVNTDTVNPAVFMCKESVVLFKSELDVSDLGSNVDIMTAETDSGLTLVFARQGAIDDLSAKYRLTFWNRAHVVNPLKCGILLPSQNAAI